MRRRGTEGGKKKEGGRDEKKEQKTLAGWVRSGKLRNGALIVAIYFCECRDLPEIVCTSLQFGISKSEAHYKTNEVR